MTWDSLVPDVGQRFSIFTDHDEKRLARLDITRQEDGTLALGYGCSGELSDIATSPEAMMMFLARVGDLITREFSKREGFDA